MACADCIVSMYNHNVCFENGEYIGREVACPMCRHCSGHTHVIAADTPFKTLSGAHPVADDMYDTYDTRDTHGAAARNTGGCAAATHTCPYCAYTGALKDVCNHILNNCTYLPILCALCGQNVQIQNIENHRSVCTHQKCKYCDMVADRRKIRTHENAHIFYKKLQLQLLGIVSMIDNQKIPVDICKANMKIETVIDLLRINKKLARRL